MKHHQKGLTLVELLVALFVFGLIASAAVYALKLTVDAREQLGEADDDVAAFEIARMTLKDDFAQIVPNRMVRDEYGAIAGPPFLGGRETLRRSSVDGERLLVAFVRGGWANPEFAAARSSLQYVEYIVKDGALVRRSRAYLDDARGSRTVERVLLRDVGEAEVEFLVGEAPSGLVWADGWPAPGRVGGAPLAVALIADAPRFGELRQLFWIGDLGSRRGGGG